MAQKPPSPQMLRDAVALVRRFQLRERGMPALERIVPEAGSGCRGEWKECASMFLTDVTEQGAGPALVKMLAFQESRLQMIAENIANAQTPGYRTKQLDVAAFQASLREALEQRRGQPTNPFILRQTDEVQTDGQGFLRVAPSEEPAENVLFHDGTNVSIERQMADLAQTGLWSELATKLLQTKFDRLRSSIRGSVG